MKRLVILLLSLTIGLYAYSQETSSPSDDTEIERKCTFMDIEGKIYEDVTVKIKSRRWNVHLFYTTKDRVIVRVIDKDGNQIYKHKFVNDYLYIFSSGQLQVGRPKFNRVIIYRDDSQATYYGIIREKEGVFH